MTLAASLTTERVVLEPQSIARFDQWLALERARDEPGHADLTEDQAWLRLLARVGNWTAFGYGFYYLLDRISGEMVGEAGFQNRHRALGPRFDGFPEAAWAVTEQRQGQGFASEAMRAILDHHGCNGISADFGDGDGTRVVALIETANIPSAGLAVRLGFSRFAQVLHDNELHDLYER